MQISHKMTSPSHRNGVKSGCYNTVVKIVAMHLWRENPPYQYHMGNVPQSSREADKELGVRYQATGETRICSNPSERVN